MLTSNKLRDATPESGLAEAVFDRQAALDLGGGDEAFLTEVIGLFLDDAPTRMAEICEAVRVRDAKRLAAAAHALKGSAGCLSAGPMMTAALRMEDLGRGGDLRDAETILTNVEMELERLVAALSADVAAPGARLTR